MSELRWNPLLGTYTMVAANRQNRPHLPKDYCPFCPGSGKVPEEYDVYLYPNDFPVLKQEPDKVFPFTSELYHNREAYGKCEVVLYAPGHHTKLYELSDEHLLKLVQLWTERFNVLKQDKRIQYIFPFENRGEEVGVTMPHPHGQLYAYSFIPLKIKTELDNCKKWYDTHQSCMICEMNKTELESGKRVLYENKDFVAYLPYFTDYPFGLFVVPKKHICTFAGFDLSTQQSLADMLKTITGTFDEIYQRPFPYMMCIHQGVVNSDEYKDCSDYYHFHIEFYPPLRAADKVKWYASSEMGAWAATNVVAVENSIEVLREAMTRYNLKSGKKDEI